MRFTISKKKKYFGYAWHNFLEKNTFFPRILYKNIIISKARWVLNKKNIENFLKYYENDKLLLKKIMQWKKTFSVPKYVELVEGDNTLLID